MDLTNKNILITGAGSGIGKATALRLASLGANVVLAGRTEVALQTTMDEIEANGGNGFYKSVDITKETEVKTLIDDILNKYGKLDGAYNNAGTIGAFLPLVEQSEQDFDTTFTVNAKGVWLCMKYEALAMIRTGGGSIVNCSSWLSKGALVGSSVYSGSKAAIDGIMRAAALEWAQHHIRVNNIAPGGIATQMTRKALQSEENVVAFGKTHPIGRLGEPEEVAQLVAFLLSDSSSFMTGEHLLIDGGYTIPGQRS